MLRIFSIGLNQRSAYCFEHPFVWSARIMLLVVALTTAQAAAATTVAVLPFADLSGEGRAAGEAIRETVTSDLRSVPNIHVVERARLAEVLGEQRLQTRPDIDVESAVAMGRIVGATLIVTGACQCSGETIRLTARFIRVETGEIIGTAKVDGPATDFLLLQDRVTNQLARSAGLAFRSRPRRSLRNPRVVETYGAAVVERDEARRYELLRAAITEEPEFEYALRDLDELEKRMQELASRVEAEREDIGLAKVQELVRHLDESSAPDERARAWFALFDELHAQLRFRRLLDMARQAVARPPLPTTTPFGAKIDERARFEFIQALCIFKTDADRILHEGERFLITYPTSRYFDNVKRFMEYAIRWKRKVEAGPGNAAARLERLSPFERENPCQVAHIYHEERQLKEAARYYERCAADPRADQNSLMNLINVYIAIPDFKAARRALSLLRTRFPGVADGLQGKAWREIPIDAD